MILRLILFIVIFYIAAFLIGSLYAGGRKTGDNGAAVCFVMGFAALAACLEILAVVLGSLGASLTALSYGWTFLAAAAALTALILGIRSGTLKELILSGGERTRRNLRGAGRAGAVFLAAALFLILAETILSAAFAGGYGGAGNRIAAAVAALEQDRVAYGQAGSGYLHGFFLLPAVVARLTGLHPLAAAKIGLPLMTIPASFLTYLALGNRLFRDRKDRAYLFLLFVALISLLGFQSVYMEETYLPAAPYSGEAFCANILIPLLFCLFFMASEQRLLFYGDGAQSGAGKNFKLPAAVLTVWIAGASASAGAMAGITLLILAALAVQAAAAWRNAGGEREREEAMGQTGKDGERDGKKERGRGLAPVGSRGVICVLAVVLVLFMAGTIFSVVKLNAKINTLYHAARDLEQTYSSQAHIYEIRQDGSGDVVGYAMNLTDGKLVLLDGGDAGNASYLHEFIAGHGGVVDTWYMTEKKKNSAYDALVKEDHEDITLGRVVYRKGK